jgi:GxxExxY protein
METREEIEALAKKIVHIAYQIHVELGPGLFESVYEEVFCLELKKINLEFKRQHPVDIFYKEHRIERAFICDLFVEETIIVELKSIEQLHPVHFKQLGTYLKLTGIRLGLLINFNEALIKEGVNRVVNGL